MAVFAMATSMAAVGGALFGASQHFVTEINFQYIQSLFLLLVVAIWGIRSPTGALLGGISLATITQLVPHLPPRFQILPYLFTGLGAIGLVRYPGGVISQFAAAKETMQARFAAPGTSGTSGTNGTRPSTYTVEEVRPVAVAAD
jgi:branched-chain amino acid transport system permease protein